MFFGPAIEILVAAWVAVNPAVRGGPVHTEYNPGEYGVRVEVFHATSNEGAYTECVVSLSEPNPNDPQNPNASIIGEETIGMFDAPSDEWVCDIAAAEALVMWSTYHGE